MKLSGWGRYPMTETRLQAPRSVDGLRASLENGPVIARGAGRAYGDSAIGESVTLSMAHFNRLLDFDPHSGLVTAEAGVLLADIIAVFLKRGWFPPVTPGTKFVTLGGMIATDVHGKNHHGAGSFRNHVAWFDLLTAAGDVARCSARENTDLFQATMGGMGLTGIILRAAFRLLRVETGWIHQETVVAGTLDDAMATFERSADWPYSVAWIDCLASGRSLGRSLIHLGRHARRIDLDANRADAPFVVPTRRPKRVPFDAPGWMLNPWSVRAFNELYFRKGSIGRKQRIVDWDSYFYPLDALRDWNRIYGRRGFVQFQCVLPRARSRAGLTALLRATAKAGQGSFLAVLKLFGAQDSPFSFPMEGYTLALDFPATPRALALLDRLDRITLDHGGRFYLAKDARMSASTAEAADARLAAFRRLREETGAAPRFGSAQSRRLAL